LESTNESNKGRKLRSSDGPLMPERRRPSINPCGNRRTREKESRTKIDQARTAAEVTKKNGCENQGRAPGRKREKVGQKAGRYAILTQEINSLALLPDSDHIFERGRIIGKSK